MAGQCIHLGRGVSHRDHLPQLPSVCHCRSRHLCREAGSGHHTLLAQHAGKADRLPGHEHPRAERGHQGGSTDVQPSGAARNSVFVRGGSPTHPAVTPTHPQDGGIGIDISFLCSTLPLQNPLHACQPGAILLPGRVPHRQRTGRQILRTFHDFIIVV